MLQCDKRRGEDDLLSALTKSRGDKAIEEPRAD